MCAKTVQSRFCTQATQLSRLSNEAAFRLHESRGQGPGVLVAFVEVNINLSVPKVKHLGNALALTSIYAEDEEELQEASSKVELHGHSS